MLRVSLFNCRVKSRINLKYFQPIPVNYAYLVVKLGILGIRLEGLEPQDVLRLEHLGGRDLF